MLSVMRDKGCAFPRCGHIRFVDLHPIRHWADGGETCVENLVLMCSNHHKRVHESGYSIGRDQSAGLFSCVRLALLYRIVGIFGMIVLMLWVMMKTHVSFLMGWPVRIVMTAKVMVW